MSDLQAIITTIDQLEPQDLIRLRHYVEAKTKTAVYSLSSEQLAEINEVFRPVQTAAANMTDEEIDAAIAEVVTEARHERQAKSRR